MDFLISFVTDLRFSSTCWSLWQMTAQKNFYFLFSPKWSFSWVNPIVRSVIKFAMTENICTSISKHEAFQGNGPQSSCYTNNNFIAKEWKKKKAVTLCWYSWTPLRWLFSSLATAASCAADTVCGSCMHHPKTGSWMIKKKYTLRAQCVRFCSRTANNSIQFFNVNLNP